MTLLSNIFDVTHEGDCGVQSFPAIPDCGCQSPRLYQSQISELLLYPNGSAMPDDWSSRADYQATIDNTLSGISKGKILSGVGSIDIPEKTTYTMPKFVPVDGYRLYSLNFTVFSMHPYLYGLFRSLQCGSTDFVFTFTTLSHVMYYKTGGIQPWRVDVVMPKSQDRKAIELAIITIQWWAKTDPDRVIMSKSICNPDPDGNVFGPEAGDAFGIQTDEVFGF